MSSKPVTAVGAALIAIFCATTLVVAEQRGTPPGPPPLPPAPPGMPQVTATAIDQTSSRRVDIVLSRFLGEKRVTSLPFSLVVGDSGRGSLRLGVEVPTGETRRQTDAQGATRTETVSQWVGTSIDCNLSVLPNGRYRLQLTVLHSLLALAPQASPQPGVTPQPVVPVAAGIANATVRSVTLSNLLLVQDGQPLQFSAGVDQFTGETLRAEVTVTTVK